MPDSIEISTKLVERHSHEFNHDFNHLWMFQPACWICRKILSRNHGNMRLQLPDHQTKADVFQDGFGHEIRRECCDLSRSSCYITQFPPQSDNQEVREKVKVFNQKPAKWLLDDEEKPDVDTNKKLFLLNWHTHSALKGQRTGRLDWLGFLMHCFPVLHNRIWTQPRDLATSSGFGGDSVVTIVA